MAIKCSQISKQSIYCLQSIAVLASYTLKTKISVSVSLAAILVRTIVYNTEFVYSARSSQTRVTRVSRFTFKLKFIIVLRPNLLPSSELSPQSLTELLTCARGIQRELAHS